VTKTIEGAFSARIDDIFAEWNRDDSPGAAVTVLLGGDVVHQRAYGMANLDHGITLAPDSVFHVASVSKQFTAIAVALLAEEGKLSLDDDIRRHVPEMPDLGHVMTIRHCVHHTSGLRDQYGLFRLAGWRDDDTQTFADVLDFAYRHERLNFVPGDEYRYCNTSYTLLALIVERVSGQPFRAFVKERLLDPLGMTNSHVHDDHNAIVPRRASAYAARDDGGLKVADSTVSAPGAICLYTTVEDLARWVDNFRTREVAAGVLEAAMTSGTLNDGSPTHYGYGLTVTSHRGQRLIGHGGVDSGYRARVSWFPEEGLGVIVLCNYATMKPLPLALRIAEIVIPDRLGADEIADAPYVATPIDELEALVGVYHTTPSQQTREIILRDGKLVMPSGLNEDWELTPIGHRRFRADDPPFEIRFSGPDSALELHETNRDGETRSYIQLAPYTPEIEELAAIVGSYHSPELGATYRVALKDGALSFGERKNGPRALRPLAPNLFAVEGYGGNTLTVSHDSYGQVKELQLFNERIRYLRFART
jgi:CubicO group peptidase (beta-lactamase class C family)